jgi:hypothetical protein
MVMHTVIPVSGMLKQENHEFKTNLGYTVSSRLIQAIQQDSVKKKQNKTGTLFLHKLFALVQNILLLLLLLLFITFKTT